MVWLLMLLGIVLVNALALGLGACASRNPLVEQEQQWQDFAEAHQ